MWNHADGKSIFCGQVPIIMFHMWPRVQAIQYIINRCCQNFWKLGEAGGSWKPTGSGV